MSKIDVVNLTFAYEGTYDEIFENVSFQLDTDWKTGFTGRNGRGKTTFLNLLRGKYHYQGRISASVQFDYFPFEVEDIWSQTWDVVTDLNPEMELWQVKKELNPLELDDEVLYRPFGTLSQGEQTKVLLAVLFLRENHFLLIDEPTNHLDMHAREVVAEYLNSKKGFILVSHDRAFLDRCVDHMLVINRTNIEVQKGNFSSWYYNKELQDDYEREKNDRLKKEIHRLEETAREKATWSDRVEATKFGGGPTDRGNIGHKAAKMMKRSKTLEKRQTKAIEEKRTLLKNIEEAEDLKIHQEKYHTRRLIEAEDLVINYDGQEIFEPLRFTVEQGEQVALCGRNGCGKSSLIKLMLGEKLDYSGIIRIGSGLKISYISQDTSFLKGDLKELIQSEGLDESLFKAILRKLDFERKQFEKPVDSYSEGQKKKVLIARSLCQRAHLYIWDEPLNFIDVYSRMQIERLLLEYRPTLLFVEHDRTFTEHVATKQVEIRRV
ncbi:MAG: ABC-F type ribosomal protection protein [Firmicutes bacterium]|nr:ABC-F type ribosomal protection protein [Bacillota bacterium]